MSLLLQMRQVKDLSPSERHIVDYIFDNVHEVANIGIIELSQKTYTSTSTVKRLCKKLGIDSYIDFRLQLSMELSSYLKNSIIKEAQEPVGRYDSVKEIIKKVSNQNAKSIIDSASIDQTDAFERVIKLMCKSSRIDFYGIGPSNVVAQDAEIKCLRLGINTSAYGNHIQMLINAKASTPDRMAFLISYTGETDDILNVAKELNKRGVPTIGITSIEDNNLSKICTESLFVESSESWNRLGGMSSRISTLNIIDILFTAYINNDYDKNTAKAHNTYVGKGANFINIENRRK